MIGAVFGTEDDGAKESKGFAGAALLTLDAVGAKSNPFPAVVVVPVILLRFPGGAVDDGPGKPPNVLETVGGGKAPVVGACDGANPAVIPDAGVGAKLANGLAAGAALVGANEFVGNGFCCCCCCCGG